MYKWYADDSGSGEHTAAPTLGPTPAPSHSDSDNALDILYPGGTVKGKLFVTVMEE